MSFFLFTQVRLSQNCSSSVTKMQQCRLCGGHQEKPCGGYCVSTIKGCLNNFNELDQEWDNFVATMDRLAERLLGSFNIVMVVEPINIKISEAIMNFQESGNDISQRVFEGCGKPVLGRSKRAAEYRARQSNQLIRNLVEENTFERGGGGDEQLLNDSKYDFLFEDENESGIAAISSSNGNNLLSRLRRTADPEPGNREIDNYEPVQFTNTDDYNSNKGRRKNKNNKKQLHHDHANNQTDGSNGGGHGGSNEDDDNGDQYINKEPGEFIKILFNV